LSRDAKDYTSHDFDEPLILGVLNADDQDHYRHEPGSNFFGGIETDYVFGAGFTGTPEPGYWPVMLALACLLFTRVSPRI